MSSIFQSSAMSKPAFQAHESGLLCCSCNIIDITTNPVAADTYELCKVPAGATVVGGWFMAPDLDTGGETLDMDIGWKANGVESADPDGFGNLGVLTGDSFALGNVSLVVGLLYPLQGVLLTAGPKTFTNETVIEMVANVTAASGGTGIITLRVDYLSP